MLGKVGVAMVGRGFGCACCGVKPLWKIPKFYVTFPTPDPCLDHQTK